jgi:predicted transcriptional regulator
LIHAGAKTEIEELAGVRRSLQGLLGKEFVKKSDEDYSCLNKVVAENIDLKIPEEGEVIKRLVELAAEKNIKYVPSHEATIALNDYCTRKNIKNPLGGAQPSLASIPQYNPAGMPAPLISEHHEPQQ